MSLYHPPLKFPHVVCLSITPHLTFMLDSQSGRAVCTTCRYVPYLILPHLLYPSFLPQCGVCVCVGMSFTVSLIIIRLDLINT